MHVTRTNKVAISEFIIGGLFLVCGCAIYLLFRTKTLNIYRWTSLIGFSDYVDYMRQQVLYWNIPSFVKYCLPDGLYCAAYILMIDAIWYNDKGIMKKIIMSFVPIVTIISEVLQYFGLIKGTFDIYDLTCYTIPPVAYVSAKYANIMFNYKRIKE